MGYLILNFRSRAEVPTALDVQLAGPSVSGVVKARTGQTNAIFVFNAAA